ncbi:MAG: hypothetical protein AABM67_08135 [Acidobacteriota bacterium]
MAIRKRKAMMALAAFFAFGLSQVYVHAGLPGSPPDPQRTITATLKTKNNQTVTINGNPGGTGTTLLTGSTIQTPDQVSATIDLGPAGTVEVGPNSQIELSFDAQGNIHVKLVRGCAMTKKKAEGFGEADVATDTVTDATNPKKKQAGGCLLPNGSLGSFSTGGLSAAQGAAIGAGIAGGVAGTVLVERGGNNSEITE